MTISLNMMSPGAMSVAKRAVSLCLFAAVVSACSSNNIKDDEFFEPAELQKIDRQVELKRNWSGGVGDGQGKRYVRLEPFYRSGSLVVASHDGVVQRLDADTGNKQWQVKSGLPISGGPAMDNGQVFLGTLSGDVVALSADDGSELWRTALSSEVLSAPRSNGDIVVVHCYDGRIYGLRHGTGEQVWEHETQNPRLTLRGSSSPLMLNDLAIIGTASGKMIALDSETGILRWEQRVALAQGRSEIERMVDIDAGPVLDGGLLFTVSYQGRVVVMDAATGRILWRKEASSYVGLATGFGNLYVAEADGKLSAYKVNDGSLQWQLEDLSWRKLSAPATIGPYVAVADFDGYIHLISQIDGQIAGRERVDGSGVRAPLLRYRDSLLAFSNKGKLVSYSIKE